MANAILSVPEAARLIGVSEARVRQLIRRGRLYASRVGPVYLILRSDAEAYRDSPRQPGPVPRPKP